MSDKERERFHLLLTAGLFALRLYRRKDDDVSIGTNIGWPEEKLPKFLEIEARSRTETAARSALDAAAIIAAVDGFGGTS